MRATRLAVERPLAYVWDVAPREASRTMVFPAAQCLRLAPRRAVFLFPALLATLVLAACSTRVEELPADPVRPEPLLSDAVAQPSEAERDPAPPAQHELDAQPEPEPIAPQPAPATAATRADSPAPPRELPASDTVLPEARQAGEAAARIGESGGERLQEASASTKTPGAFLFVPAPGKPGVLIPREERLTYQVYVDLSLVESNVGTVTQTCTVAEQRAPLIVAQSKPAAGDAASIKLEAEGSYFWYELKSTLETRVLPQEWPRMKYSQESESSRGTRRREVMLGRKDGKWISSYRGDTSKGAPPGTRIWRQAEEREVPEGTLDMLTSVFMARALIAEEKETMTFPLIDKDRLWNLTLRRGEEQRMQVGAGEFDAVEVVLEPEPYPGEDMEEKAKEFEGVFGIHGTIHLWVDKKTGIAVRIQGDLPINDGMITLGIDVLLDSYSGTTPEFAPLAAEKR